MGVARIPLLDFDLLHNEVERIRPSLSSELLEREQLGTTRLFIRSDHAVVKQISSSPSSSSETMTEIKSSRSAIAGMISPSTISKYILIIIIIIIITIIIIIITL